MARYAWHLAWPWTLVPWGAGLGACWVSGLAGAAKWTLTLVLVVLGMHWVR